ncbi:MAG: gliding motility-associated C-terminal domain-containing protein [Maribacter sp.]
MNFSKVFKGLLFLSILLFSSSTVAQVVNVSVANGPAEEENLVSATFKITMSGLLRLTPTTISYAMSGPADEGVDYETIGTVAIPPGGSEVDVEIVPFEDTAIEGNNDVIFTILPSLQYIVGANGTATTTIDDNDIGEVTLVANRPATAEGGAVNGRFRINLSGPNETGLSLIVTGDFGGDATATGPNADFTTTGNGTFTNATQIAKNINIIAVDDTQPESQETVTYKLTATGNPWFVLGAAADIVADVTIDDNDCASGTTPPALNNNPTSLCDVPSVDLNSFYSGAVPAASALRFSTVPNPSEAQLLSVIASSAITTSGTYYALFGSSGGATFCTSPSTQLDIVIETTPNAGANSNTTACNNPDDTFGATLIDLDDLLSVGADVGSWSFVSGPQTANPNAANRIQFRNRPAGSYVYSFVTSGAVAPCTNDSSTHTIIVDDCDPCVAGIAAPVLFAGAPETVYCRDVGNNEIISLNLDNFTTAFRPTGTELRWSTIADLENENAHLTSSTINISTGATYRGFFWDDLNKCASPALVVSILIKPIPVLTGGEDQERCGPGTMTLTATASLNATINWYGSATGGSIIDSGASFTTPIISSTTSYYAEATLNGCTSDRVQITATIIPQPSAGVIQNGGIASSCSDADNGPTILDLDDLISGEDAGAWVYTSGPLANFTIPANSILNFAGNPDGDYVFTYTTTGAQAPCLNESSEVTISVNDCDIDTDLDGLFDGPEAILGTDPNNPDTDGDGIEDGDEVGADLDNPTDSDVDSDGMPSPDGIIDALDSNILDADNDGVVDQLDPSNENPCIPTRINGVCDFDGDDVADIDDPEPDDPCLPNMNHPNCNPDPIDLEVLKTVDNINGLIGDTVTFTITVNNRSATDARNVLIGDLLESGFEYQTHTPVASAYDPDLGEWNIPMIAATGSVTLDVTVLIVEGGVYSNTAELLDSFPMDNTPENNAETVILPIELPVGVNLVLEKRVSLGLDKEKLNTVSGLVNTLETEVEVFYFIKVINKSQQDAVSNISVADIFTNDEAVEFEITETMVPENTTFDINTGIWTIDRSLEIDQEIELSYRVVYSSVGTVTNVAQINRSTPSESIPQDNDSNDMAVVTITTRNLVEVGILYNQFSPNNDGLNDDLKINLIKSNADGSEERLDESQVRYNIQIYNRYGNLVFESENKSQEEIWDGSWKGKDSPAGTYFYTMNVQIDGEEAKIQKGWVQLIR